MKRTSRRLLISFLLFYPLLLLMAATGNSYCLTEGGNKADTLKENQILYRGRVWRNLYVKIEGDQFLNTSEFMPGSVSVGGTKYDKIYLKYDIFNDEILTTTNKGIIIQLNKEMIDSFSISYLNIQHHFKNLKHDSTSAVNGYVDALCEGSISLYVKYMKKIDPISADKKYESFFQMHRVFVEKDGIMHPVSGKRDIFRLFSEEKQKMKDFIRSNKLSVQRRNPESFIPLIAFCNSFENR